MAHRNVGYFFCALFTIFTAGAKRSEKAAKLERNWSEAGAKIRIYAKNR